MTTQAPPPMNQEQLAEWVKIQFQRANKHLAENGVLFDTVVTGDSRYLAPYLALWKIKAHDGKQYWVLGGDLPSDFTLADNAPDAREALKYFALSWQMKAQSIQAAAPQDKTQQEFAELLINRAEVLYDMHKQDRFWQK